MEPIVLATGNPHKVEELRAIFAAVGRPVLGLGDLPGVDTAEPAETGATFDDNATIKALAYAERTGRLCLADDSGLEIDALGGEPGVISSHYATRGVETGLSRAERDRANNALVLERLRGVPAERRAARFVCVMVAARPGRVVARARGTFEGRIAEAPRGSGGFGYDPLLLVAPAFDRSAAELTPDQKNALSHRGQAARAVAALLAGRDA